MKPLRIVADDAGVTAIEYALAAALIAMVILVSVSLVGVEVLGLYQRVCNRVVEAIGGGAC